MEKKFKVIPSGVIKGGEAFYTLSEDMGTIYYEASVKAGLVWPLTKVFNFSGSYKIDPKLLDPKNLDEVGESEELGNVEFKVLQVTGKASQVSITVHDQQMTGVASVLLNSPIEVTNLNAKALVSGYNVNLILEAI